MKRKLSILSIVFILILALAGCSNSSSTDKKGSSSPKASDSGKKLDINLSTATTTGVYYPLGAAFAKMWNDKLPDVSVSSAASDGSVQNINLMQQGKINMAFTTIGVLWSAYNGKDQFKGRPYKDVRILAAIYPNVGQVVARKNSGVKSIADFKGKKFVPGAPGSSTRVLSDRIFGAYGLSLKDTNAQYVGFTEATNLMRNNQVDGAIIMAGVPTSAVVEMLSSANGELVNLGDKEIASLSKKYPWLSKYTIKSGTYDGQKQDINTVAQTNVLIVPKDLPDDKVYELTKTLWENIGPIGDSIAAAKGSVLEKAATNLAGIPLHPGAEKYYKEKGVLK